MRSTIGCRYPDGMAIAFARARYISRGSGGSAVRSAAYNAREAIRAERTGALYYFAHRDEPEHHEVLLPEGASRTPCGGRRAVERGGGGGEAARRAACPRDRAGAAGECGGHGRGPDRAGAALRA